MPAPSLVWRPEGKTSSRASTDQAERPQREAISRAESLAGYVLGWGGRYGNLDEWTGKGTAIFTLAMGGQGDGSRPAPRDESPVWLRVILCNVIDITVRNSKSPGITCQENPRALRHRETYAVPPLFYGTSVVIVPDWSTMARYVSTLRTFLHMGRGSLVHRASLRAGFFFALKPRKDAQWLEE